jgi:hypothetical protein
MRKSVSLGLAMAITFSAFAQQFVQRVGNENILNGIDVGVNSAPVFVDIDNDLDQDMFVGTGSGVVLFFRNTGNSAVPQLTLQNVQTNPLGSLNVGGSANLSFVDIDQDGDYDTFVGSRNGEIRFYRNEGTRQLANFNQEIIGNPLGQVLTEYQSSCSFVDIDGDLDMDVFVGGDFAIVACYLNTGTPQNPIFILADDSVNPLQLIEPAAIFFPVFVDIDNDTDMDAILGSSGNSIEFYKNVGSKINPVFARQTGTLNPFNLLNQAYSLLLLTLILTETLTR